MTDLQTHEAATGTGAGRGLAPRFPPRTPLLGPHQTITDPDHAAAGSRMRGQAHHSRTEAGPRIEVEPRELGSYERLCGLRDDALVCTAQTVPGCSWANINP